MSSNKTKTTNTPQPQDNQQAEDVKQGKPRFVFSQYSDIAEVPDDSDIEPLLAEGYDPSPHHFAWMKHNQHSEAERRYFTRVTQATHGHMFKEEAFDAVHGVIGRGAQNMKNTMGGIPELYLYERPIEAEQAEMEQMTAKSRKRSDPTQNAELQEIRQRMGNAIGMKHVRGGVRSGWGQ